MDSKIGAIRLYLDPEKYNELIRGKIIIAQMGEDIVYMVPKNLMDDLLQRGITLPGLFPIDSNRRV